MSEKNVPNVRFKGFSESWEQRKLGNLIKIDKEQEVKKETLDNSGNGYYVLAMRTFSTDGYIDFSKPYWSSNVKTNKEDQFLLPGEFAIIDADMDSKLPKIGKVLFNSYDQKFLLAAHVRKILVNHKYNDTFIYALMRNDDLLKQLKLEAGGSISKRLLDKNVYKQNVRVPSNKEQNQIGELSKIIEKNIASNQRKLDQLKEVKKLLMQKIFDQEWRFKGFTDPWEQRKLENMATFLKGKGYSKSDLVNKGYPIILYGRMYTNYETVIDQITDTFVTDISDAQISTSGDVIVPGSGETAMDISRASNVKISGVVLGGDINIIKPNLKSLDSTFLAYTISNGKQQKELTKRAQGKSVVHLHNSDLKKVVLNVPSKAEQIKIATLLQKIESAIASNQQKLDQLKEMKKWFMQNMFV